MNIQDAMQESVLIKLDGANWYMHWNSLKGCFYRTYEDGKMERYKLTPKLLLREDWQPHFEVKEIMPEKAGELWEGCLGGIYTTFEDSEKGLRLRAATSGEEMSVDVFQNYIRWTRLFPPVEDESVERIEFDNIRWDLSDCWQKKPMPYVEGDAGNIKDWGGIRSAATNKPPMKMILEISKED